MKKNLCVFMCALFLFAFSSTTRGQVISTYAGSTVGYSGDNGPASTAQLSSPYAVARDGAGNLYISDQLNYVVRKISPAGVITTVAGNNTNGYSGDNGAATNAQLSPISGIATDIAGNLYIADHNNQVIRKVDGFGIITTFAGNNTFGYSGDGGLATNAQLANPSAIAVDALGNVYFTEESNSVVRMVNALGIISTVAGTGTSGYSGDGFAATNAQLNNPRGLAFDAAGNMYFSELGNDVVRKVDLLGTISTIAGNGTSGFAGDGGPATAALLNSPVGLSTDASNNLYIADVNNNVVRRINPTGTISTFAGNQALGGGYTGNGGPATAAQLFAPAGQVSDNNGNVYIADFLNNLIRLVGNNAPMFVGGPAQAFSICQDATAMDISGLFAITDLDAGQTEIWTQTGIPPLHGILTGFPTTGTSTGGTITPSGITYTPTPGYSGSDIFSVMVDDGNGGTSTTTINVTVNGTPTMFNPGNQLVCNNTSTSTINFTSAGSGVTYSWTNSDPSIGLAASGTGNNIPSFTAINPTTATVTATITVTPSANTCTGVPQTFTITVYPTPDVAFIGNQVVCNGALTAPVIFSGPVAGTAYNWTNSDPSIGLAGTGSGNIASFSAINTSNSPAVSNVVVTPTANGCNGVPKTFSITVNPTPNVAVPVNQFVCNGSPTATVNFSGPVAGTTYGWTNSNTTIGLAASGVGDINSFTATNTTTGNTSGTITVTPTANGCSGAPQSFTVTVYPTPVLNPTPATTTICNNTLFHYVSTSLTAGTTFNWTRNTITGITNPAASGADTIDEVLNNNISAPVTVTYIDTLRANGCINVQNILVTVNPTPTLSSSTVTTAICDSTVFNYTPTSAVSGATFAWTRAFVVGIDKPAGAGVGSIHDTLVNQTDTSHNVTYSYIVTANGCTNTQNIVVTVRPTPRLSSDDSLSVCTGAPFTYAATGRVNGSTFSWTRASVAGITPATGSSTSGGISETLTNSGSTPLNAIYVYTVTANSCSHRQAVVLTVNPAPAVPSIDNNPPTALCSNTMNQSFGTSVVPASGVSYVWTASNATVFATGTNKQYAIVNFPNAGTSVVTLTAKGAGGCTSSTNVSVNVGPGVADAPARVTYFNGQFVCLQNIESSYQWGYDDAMLKSTLLAGEINQNYYNTTPDLTNKHYWVMVGHNGCTQKAYYNSPLDVMPNVDVTGVKVYPNPANDQINVAISSTMQSAVQVEVFNMLGQVVRTATTENNMASINVKELAAGIYILNCTRDGVKVATARFIKN